MDLLQLVFLSVLLPCALGQEVPPCGGKMIGELPTLLEGVSGTMFVEDYRTFCIEDFNYDGGGPDTFLYFYYRGDPFMDTGGGVYVPLDDENLRFVFRQPYTNDTLRFTIPENQYRACDFEGFGMWCRSFNVHFTKLAWNTSDIFSTAPSGDKIVCDPSPGRAYMGELPLLPQGHNVSGLLYVVDNKTLVIRDFTYDGQAPAAFVYWYPPGVERDPTGGGNIIPLRAPVGVEEQEGRFGITVYELPQEDFVITIPDNLDVYTCDIGTLTIWCRQAERFFSWILFDGEQFSNNPLEVAYSPDRIFCDRPTTRPGILIGELPTTDPRAISGTFYVQNQDTFFIQLFSYDTSGEDTYLYYYPVGVSPDTTGEGGKRIRFSDDSKALPTGSFNSYYNVDFTVDLRRAVGGPVKACEVGYFSILNEDTAQIVTWIAIPQDIFATSDEMGKITCAVAAALPAHSVLGVFGALAAVLLVLIA